MTFYESLKSTALNLYCSIADISGSLWREIKGISGGTPEFGLAFREYSTRSLCNREPIPPDDFPEGGQCPNHPYFLNLKTLLRYSGGRPDEIQNNTTPELPGPIKPGSYTKTSETANFEFWTYSLGYGEGLTYSFDPVRVAKDPEGQDVISFSIVEVTIQTNVTEPPDCANKPAPLPPYNPDDFRKGGDITYVNNDGIDVTVPFVAVFAPVYIDADLNLKVPLTFTFSPNFSFNPTFKYDIQVDIDLGTGDIQPRLPTPPGVTPPRPLPDFDFDTDIDIDIDSPAPPVPPDIPDPPDEPPTDEARATIRAAIVTTTAIDNPSIVGLIGQDDNPDVWIPDLGLLSFQVRTRGGIAWTTDVKIKNKRQLIPCEWIGGAIDVRATPRPGVQLSVTPVYGQPSKEV